SIVNDGNGCCIIEANRAMAEWMLASVGEEIWYME
ncbi:MAG: hypothetical protein EZS28_019736, partial [Streblomastix strix]